MSPTATTANARTDDQLKASDPAHHVWVNASAGTGKTQVLTDRILRLMLEGADPDRILAVTFTRAAAAEMQLRLSNRLAKWLRLDDEALSAELRALSVTPVGHALQRARALFALALDVPGGLKVQTLHGFAQGLLASFPVEAGLPPGFTALDERDSRRLKQRALSDVVAAAQAGDDARLLDDLATLAVDAGEMRLTRMLDRALQHSGAVTALGNAPAVEPALRRLLKLGDATREQAVAAAVAGIDEGLVRRVAAGWRAWKAATGQARADALDAWLRLPAEARAGGEARDLIAGAVLTQAGPPLKANGAAKNTPTLQADLDALGERLHAVTAADRAFDLLDHAARALRVGLAYARRYGQLKSAAVAIDYDDMIARAAALLTQQGGASWVNYKLDTRIDHILVDEAQDTNEPQWAVIRALTGDFFAGAGTREGRTLFVVGDYKQAIYGFQGTDPEVFRREWNELVFETEEQDDALVTVPLDRSFRSGPAVLEFVDGFIAQATPEALGMVEEVPPHVPHRADAGSSVTLWPVQVAGEPTEEDAAAAADAPGANAAAEDADRAAADRLMADRLAAQIRDWLDPGSPDRLWLPARGRFAAPQDILVLVRKRSQLMALLVAALHRARVPVAGVDRLLLTDPLAVLDCLAALRFALQPGDDLNLACLLTSPFLGWTPEDVRAVAGPRGDATLWDALRAASDPRARDAAAWLDALFPLAETTTPYRFLDKLLSGPLQGRARLLGRLGSEAMQALDELLTQAIAFEGRHAPTHQAFLEWIEAEAVEVKRDPDAAGADVRLMTIHGAKGLEAPVVVLADAAHDPRGDDDRVLETHLPGIPEPLPLFHPGVDSLGGDLALQHAAERRAAAEEDLRLLYVALTRAADMLFIGGAVGRAGARRLNTPDDQRWHARLGRVMDALPGVETADGLWGEARRIRRGTWTAPDATVRPADARAETGTDVDLSPAADPPRPWRPLAPSAPGDDEPARAPPTPQQRRAARRGTLMHRLFERLPETAPDRREQVATRWLEHQGEESSDARDIAAAVLAVMERREFAPLFAPDALAEAPLAGLVGDAAVAGAVDRLRVDADRVLAVDFKTGLFVPGSPDRVPPQHLRQMALYRAVLRQAFPGRAVDCGLLYTSGPRMVMLPNAVLDALLDAQVEPAPAPAI